MTKKTPKKKSQSFNVVDAQGDSRCLVVPITDMTTDTPQKVTVQVKSLTPDQPKRIIIVTTLVSPNPPQKMIIRVATPASDQPK